MHTLRILLAASLATLMLPACPASAADCKLAQMSVEGSIARAHGVTANLGEADNSQHPIAWQGPLKIALKDGPVCTAGVDVSIITEPLLLGASVLYVPTYSGSDSTLYAVNIKTCRVKWKSQAYAGTTSYSAGHLILGRHPMAVPLDSRCVVKAAPSHR